MQPTGETRLMLKLLAYTVDVLVLFVVLAFILAVITLFHALVLLIYGMTYGIYLCCVLVITCSAILFPLIRRTRWQ